MSVQEISRKEWTAFCNSFSQQHQGWLVSLEVVSDDLGVIARYLPLEDIRVDKRAGSKDILSIRVGKTPDKCLSHIVIAPAQIKLEQTEKGAHQALEIQSATGATTLLRFRTTALPEMIDGVINE